MLRAPSFWTVAQRHPWVIPVLVALVVHAASLLGSFVYDDVPLIAKHPGLSSPGFLHDVWTRDYGFEYAGAARGLYRPLFMTIVFVLYQLAGASPLVFHLFSVLVFCLATTLVTQVAFLFSRQSVATAIITGLFYGLHPARVETVSLVSCLPDLIIEMSALGLVLCLVKGPTLTPFWRVSSLCLLLSMVAALTKESAFFIFTALALTAGLHGITHSTDRRRAVLPAISVVLGLLICLLPRYASCIQAPVSLLEAFSRALIAESSSTLKLLGRAAWEIIVPGPVVFWRQLGGTASLAASLTLVVSLVGIGLTWIWMIRENRLWTALLIAWLGANGVTLALLNVSGYPYSQRYLALAPALILICIGASAIPIKASLRRVAILALAATLTAHGIYAVAGTMVCWTPLGFFTAMHQANPNDVMPLGAVAQTLDESGGPADLVERCVRKATALDPKHPQVPLLHNLVIKRYLKDSSFADALRFSGWSLESFPADGDKVALKAVALANLGRHAEALSTIDQAIVINPASESYQQVRAQILSRMASTPSPR